MIRFYHWILLNIFLPFTPFLVRIFIFYMGKEGKVTLTKIAELPEIVFFSIYICVINLNINFDGNKSWFETTVRLFLFTVIVFNCITLGMIYSNNVGPNIFWYSLIAATFPTIIAPIYKFRYRRIRDL